MNFFKGNSAFLCSKEWYHNNNYSKAEGDKFYEAVAVPESRKIARDILLASFAKIDFKKPHNPLLLIGGANDHIFASQFTKK